MAPGSKVLVVLLNQVLHKLLKFWVTGTRPAKNVGQASSGHVYTHKIEVGEGRIAARVPLRYRYGTHQVPDRYRYSMIRVGSEISIRDAAAARLY